MAIPQHTIDQILDRTDIVDVIGQFVKLKKTGRTYSGCCPFHQEKSPSFHVYRDKQYFHCFGCQANGNAIRFLMDIGNRNFIEVMKDLSSQTGIELPKDNQESSKLKYKREAAKPKAATKPSVPKAATNTSNNQNQTTSATSNTASVTSFDPFAEFQNPEQDYYSDPLASNDIPTALHNYTVLAIKSNSTTVKQRALNVALEHDDLRAALDISTHWVVQEPQDVPAMFYLAHIALKAHEYELAAETLDKILQIDDSADLEEILAGIVPTDTDDRNYLIQALSSSKAKNNPSILVLVAGLEAQNGQFEQALLTINRALKKRPRSTGYILLKANLLQALDDQEQTLKWYEKASSKNRNNIEVRLAEVKYLIKLNETRLALQKLETILKKWPTHEEALFIAGLTSIDLEEYDKAEKYLVELRYSDQYQNEAYYYLAINAERKQHYETAKAYYRLVDGSLYTVSRRNMISIFSKQEKLTDALRFLTQERVNYPQHASFLYLAQADILKKMDNKKAGWSLSLWCR